MNFTKKNGNLFVLDNETFEMIYAFYYKKLLKYIFGIVKNVDNAKDIVQDLFLKLPESIKLFDSNKGSFNSWIFKVARNEALYFLRKESIRIKKLCELNEEIANDYKDDTRSQLSLTYDFVHLFNDDETEWFMLDIIQGFKTKEIANIMNISVSTVKRIRKKTLEKIKTIKLEEKI